MVSQRRRASEMEFMPLPKKNPRLKVIPAVTALNQQGLTLVEVLVTTAILSLVLALIYGTLVASIKAKEYAEKVADLEQAGLTVLNLIISDLESAFIYNQEIAFFFGTDKQIEDADADGLSLTAGGERNLLKRRGSPTAITYFVKLSPQDAKSLTLFRKETPFGSDRSAETEAVFAIVDNVKSLNLQYFDGESWQDSWDGGIEKSLPGAVKIDLIISSPKTTGNSVFETALEEAFSTVATPIIDNVGLDYGKQ